MRQRSEVMINVVDKVGRSTRRFFVDQIKQKLMCLIERDSRVKVKKELLDVGDYTDLHFVVDEDARIFFCFNQGRDPNGDGDLCPARLELNIVTMSF